MNDIQYRNVDKESEESYQKMKRSEEENMRDIVKYFDKIHDNIFTYNNLLIAAFFGLAQFQNNISRWTILIPIVNLWILLWINYRMMESARLQSNITNVQTDVIKKHGKYIRNTNLYSLLSIVSTFLVTLSFLYYLSAY